MALFELDFFFAQLRASERDGLLLRRDRLGRQRMIEVLFADVHVLDVIGTMNRLEATEMDQSLVSMRSWNLMLLAVLEVNHDVISMSQLRELILKMLGISLLARLELTRTTTLCFCNELSECLIFHVAVYFLFTRSSERYASPH